RPVNLALIGWKWFYRQVDITMTFKYLPYYEYKPTISDPLLDELSQEDIDRNMRLLVDDLKSHFSEIGGSAESSADGVISITTELTQDECDEVVAGYLSSLHL